MNRYAPIALVLGLGTSLCLLALACSQSIPQAQLGAIVAGCQASLDIVRKQGDPAQVKLVEDGCGASLHAWQEDGRPKGK